MIRLLVAILLGVVISSQAPAQNRAGQTLLALNEDERTRPSRACCARAMRNATRSSARYL
jgi:hypothetical protein